MPDQTLRHDNNTNLDKADGIVIKGNENEKPRITDEKTTKLKLKLLVTKIKRQNVWIKNIIDESLRCVVNVSL